MTREEVLVWCNSRVNKGNNFDMADVLAIRSYIHEVHDILVPTERITGSMQQTRILPRHMNNMLNHMRDRFKIIAVVEEKDLKKITQFV